MNRQFWVKVHRYAGLVMALFILVAGLTGAVLAFAPQVDRWLNPPLPVSHQGSLMDPLDLRARALALAPPHGMLNGISLHLKADEPYSVAFGAHEGPGEKAPELPFNVVRLDPYTGALLEKVKITDGLWPITRQNFLAVMINLHYRLAIPGSVGLWLFGLAALIWTFDCFVSLYLTFPVTVQRKDEDAEEAAPSRPPGKSWLGRWKRSWLLTWKGTAYRVNFDLHRAGGLWVWMLLLVLAWTGVGFNLNEQVYMPVMKTVFRMPDLFANMPDLKTPRPEPGLPWTEARALGRQHMAQQAQVRGFKVVSEEALQYSPEKGMFFYAVRSDRDIAQEGGGTFMVLDGQIGAYRDLILPTGQHPTLTFHSWIFALHTAGVWGLPYRIFLSFTGLVISMLCITGVYLWWKKRRSGRRIELQQQAASSL